jgi:hypothetical protein
VGAHRADADRVAADPPRGVGAGHRVAGGRERDPVRDPHRRRPALSAARLPAAHYGPRLLQGRERDGTAEQIHDTPRERLRAKQGRRILPTAALIDAQPVKASPNAPGFPPGA